MIGVWLATALADPGALTTGQGNVSTEVGLHERSIAVRGLGTLPDLGVSLYDRSAMTGSVGWRAPTTAAPWRAEWSGTVGATALLIQPGMAISATGGISAGRFGDRSVWAAGLVVPLVVGTTVHPLRLPALLALRTDVALGPVWLGLRLRAGPVWTPGAGLSAAIEPALSLGLGGTRAGTPRNEPLTAPETSR